MRLLFTCMVVAFLLPCCVGQDKKPGDSPLVARTRKKLGDKLSVEFKDERLKDVIKELEDKAEVKFRLDTKGGVSQNMAFTYKAEEKSLREVLDDLFKGKGLGYVIHRKQNNVDRYEGYIDIVQGDQRGDEPPVRGPGKKKP